MIVRSFFQSSKNYFAMLLLLSMVFLSVQFVVSSTEQAQGQFAPQDGPINLCIKRSSGTIFLYDSNRGCPPGFEEITSPREDGNGQPYTGLCLRQANGNSGPWQVLEIGPSGSAGYQISPNGKKCVHETDENALILEYLPFNIIMIADDSYYGTGNGNGNGNTNNGNGNTGNGNSGNSNTGNGNTRTGNSNTKNPPQVRGDCEEKFHKVGPLCVPDSPFTDPNAPINSATGAGLAVKIIRIMLYFAGIVAVIMAIIGGYHIMTAQGNEAQATNGRKTLTNAIIGLALVILSYVIIQAVISFITKGP